MPPKYEKVCPYCGKTCKGYYPTNILCECGAKYYSGTDTWLERKKKKENPELVEVVRCKDCIFARVEDGKIKCYNTYGLLVTKETEYCSRGKRREE